MYRDLVKTTRFGRAARPPYGLGSSSDMKARRMRGKYFTMFFFFWFIIFYI